MGKVNPAIGRLLAAMRKMVGEVNDQEICRRLEILINSGNDDLPAPMVRSMLDDAASFDARQVPEPYTQYVKHYLYMVKRSARERHRSAAARSRTPGPRATTARTQQPAAGTSKTARQSPGRTAGTVRARSSQKPQSP